MLDTNDHSEVRHIKGLRGFYCALRGLDVHMSADVAWLLSGTSLDKLKVYQSIWFNCQEPNNSSRKCQTLIDQK